MPKKTVAKVSAAVSRASTVLVSAMTSAGRLAPLGGVGPDRVLHEARQHGCLDALARDVAHHDADEPVIELEEVVEVAADVGRSRGRMVVVGKGEAGDRVGQLEQGGPQDLGDVVLLLVEAGVVEGGARLVADRLGQPDLALVEGAPGAALVHGDVAEQLAPGRDGQGQGQAQADARGRAA